MKRRSYITALIAAVAGMKGIRAQPAAKNPIVLYCDLSVDAAREQEMLKNFHTIFKPAAEKFPGYIDVKVLKLRTVYTGSAPAGVNYRLASIPTWTVEDNMSCAVRPIVVMGSPSWTVTSTARRSA